MPSPIVGFGQLASSPLPNAAGGFAERSAGLTQLVYSELHRARHLHDRHEVNTGTTAVLGTFPPPMQGRPGARGVTGFGSTAPDVQGSNGVGAGEAMASELFAAKVARETSELERRQQQLDAEQREWLAARKSQLAMLQGSLANAEEMLQEREACLDRAVHVPPTHTIVMYHPDEKDSESTDWSDEDDEDDDEECSDFTSDYSSESSYSDEDEPQEPASEPAGEQEERRVDPPAVGPFADVLSDWRSSTQGGLSVTESPRNDVEAAKVAGAVGEGLKPQLRDALCAALRGLKSSPIIQAKRTLLTELCEFKPNMQDPDVQATMQICAEATVGSLRDQGLRDAIYSTRELVRRLVKADRDEDALAIQHMLERLETLSVQPPPSELKPIILKALSRHKETTAKCDSWERLLSSSPSKSVLCVAALEAQQLAAHLRLVEPSEADKVAHLAWQLVSSLSKAQEDEEERVGSRAWADDDGAEMMTKQVQSNPDREEMGQVYGGATGAGFAEAKDDFEVQFEPTKVATEHSSFLPSDSAVHLPTKLVEHEAEQVEKLASMLQGAEKHVDNTESPLRVEEHVPPALGRLAGSSYATKVARKQGRAPEVDSHGEACFDRSVLREVFAKFLQMVQAGEWVTSFQEDVATDTLNANLSDSIVFGQQWWAVWLDLGGEAQVGPVMKTGHDEQEPGLQWMELAVSFQHDEWEMLLNVWMQSGRVDLIEAQESFKPAKDALQSLDQQDERLRLLIERSLHAQGMQHNWICETGRSTRPSQDSNNKHVLAQARDIGKGLARGLRKGAVHAIEAQVTHLGKFISNNRWDMLPKDVLDATVTVSGLCSNPQEEYILGDMEYVLTWKGSQPCPGEARIYGADFYSHSEQWELFAPGDEIPDTVFRAGSTSMRAVEEFEPPSKENSRRRYDCKSFSGAWCTTTLFQKQIWYEGLPANVSNARSAMNDAHFKQVSHNSHCKERVELVDAASISQLFEGLRRGDSFQKLERNLNPIVLVCMPGAPLCDDGAKPVATKVDGLRFGELVEQLKEDHDRRRHLRA
eukprot:TRINITY_DN4008_c0_g1_i1.p1 TRINITY_DN4008_c0_g1~~TRINITY_DN4008_c0_g1_i1.p1  ORF type:complete len:1042 (+),score=254.47 TRINITY_DN4008_c0_g1_i1:241-3366(+)